MMRAYFLQSIGDRMNLELREVPTPQPAAHQHLV
jgi:NADPH:quinone reductase-like Zn-dependent oxidoreductase